MVQGFILVIDMVGRLLTLIVFVDVILSFFMSPYNSIRQVMDRIVEPLLRPIRRIMPGTGMLDFSPLVLIILIQVVQLILIQVLRSMG